MKDLKDLRDLRDLKDLWDLKDLRDLRVEAFALVIRGDGASSRRGGGTA
jgi:hypothetical protein